jgi:hypothetical protein
MVARRLSMGVLGWLVLCALPALGCTLGRAVQNDAGQIATRPLVLVLAPVNGSVFAEGAQVQLYATALDPGGHAARIEFRIDDVPVGEAAAPVSGGQDALLARTVWTAADKRGHLLTVEAFRADGSSMGLSDVTLQVTDQPGTAGQTTGAESSGGGQFAPATFTPSAP